MKLFHISDVLSATTGRMLSSQHVAGVYEILNFITSDELYTHQLPRAMRECEPWLRTQFPQLMGDSPGMAERLADMDRRLKEAGLDRESTALIVRDWVEELRSALQLPEMLPVYELGAEMHTRIDPVEEAKAMFGDDCVLVTRGDEDA